MKLSDAEKKMVVEMRELAARKLLDASGYEKINWDELTGTLGILLKIDYSKANPPKVASRNPMDK